MSAATPKTIDTYLQALPELSRNVVGTVRDMLRAAAPDAVEGIKYGMPTATLYGRNIIYYAAWKKHLGLYPIYRGPPDYEAALAPYRDKKDTVRFPLDVPLPVQIVELILNTRIGLMRKNDSGGMK